MLAAKSAQVLSACSTRCNGRRVCRTVRPVVRLSAGPSGNVTVHGATAAETAEPSRPRPKMKIINLISACVESNALVYKFETFAGRVGMVAFFVAISAEAVTERGVFQALGEQEATSFAATALACVVVASVLAVLSKRKLGLPLREAVISSLTAVRRSSASITQRQVDKAVDYVFESAFDKETVNYLIDEDYL